MLVKQRRFDLVFMDCNMPEMNGFDASTAIRELEQSFNSPRTPIVAFTAYAMKGDDKKCYDAGMDDYISKPIKKREMIKCMCKWLQPQEKKIMSDDKTPQPLNGHAVPALEGDNAPHTQTPNGNFQATLDAESVEELKDLLGDNFIVFAEQYIENTEKLIQQAESALSEQNVETIYNATHTLRSGSAQIGATELADIALSIETLAQQQMQDSTMDIIPFEAKIHNLRQSYNYIQPAIKKEAGL